MEHQNWEPTVWKKSGTQATASDVKRPPNAPGTSKFRQLDSDEPPAPQPVPLSIRMTTQKARLAKKMTQKELANKVNLPVNLVNDFEAGKAKLDPAALGKISRVLGVKLN